MLPLRHEQYLAARVQEGVCSSCHEKKESVDVQYSFGVIAGVLCRECAIANYRAHCGLTGHMGTKAEYEELEGPGSYDGEEEPFFDTAFDEDY